MKVKLMKIKIKKIKLLKEMLLKVLIGNCKLLLKCWLKVLKILRNKNQIE